MGADKGYDTKDSLSEARNLTATPHVAQNIYSALLNDSARNGMIVADFVQAIPAGRCPLLLSLLQRATECKCATANMAPVAPRATRNPQVAVPITASRFRIPLSAIIESSYRVN